MTDTIRWMMDGARPGLRVRRLIEAVVAASLLSGISVVVVNRHHGRSAAPVAANAAQDGPAARRGFIVVDLRTGP